MAALPRDHHPRRETPLAAPAPSTPVPAGAVSTLLPPARRQAARRVTPIRKPVRHRDQDHLAFVATQPCLICQRAPCDAHHLRFAQPRALGRKVSDEFTVPLCRDHHSALHHQGNEAAWWANVGIAPLPMPPNSGPPLGFAASRQQTAMRCDHPINPPPSMAWVRSHPGRTPTRQNPRWLRCPTANFRGSVDRTELALVANWQCSFFPDRNGPDHAHSKR